MIFTMSLKNVRSFGVLKSETLHVTQYLQYQYQKHINKENVTCFPSEALLCSKNSLALLNMRWYLTHLLKVLHLCWFNKRNNKRVLFVTDCELLISQSFLMEMFIKNQNKIVTLSQMKQKVNVLPFKINQDQQYKNNNFQKSKTFSKAKAVEYCQLFGLTHKKNKTKYTPFLQKGRASGMINKELKTKINVFNACQKSRCSMISTKSKILIGLFSNSTVAFKNNYLMLNNLLDYETLDVAKTLVINRQSWSGFTAKKETFNIKQYQYTVYDKMISQWYKKECVLIAKSPWKLEAELVFFTNPGKTYAMVEQIRRLGIPTSGLVDGCQSVVNSKSDYDLFAPAHIVDYPIIGNAASIYFVRSLLTKCLALTKKHKLKSKFKN